MTVAAKKKTPPPSRDNQLAEMPDEYVMGRAFGHNFKIVMKWGAKVGNVTYTGYATVVKKCRDCPYKVTQIFDGQMGLVEEHREPPKGYAITGQGRGNYRREARLELLRRS
jgi:hypothetical protein